MGHGLEADIGRLHLDSGARPGAEPWVGEFQQRFQERLQLGPGPLHHVTDEAGWATEFGARLHLGHEMPSQVLT